MRKEFYDDPSYKEKQAAISRNNWERGKYTNLLTPLEERICINPDCNRQFNIKPYNPKKFCSQSCSAHYNNLKRIKKPQDGCLACGKLPKRREFKYWSIKCQSTYQYQRFITRWKLGLENGNCGIKTRTLSRHIRKYLEEKLGMRCSECKWEKVNQVTKRVPLEIDHIDGDAENNKEENLRLLCPSCHSLTPNFRNLNKGKGRSWRK